MFFVARRPSTPWAGEQRIFYVHVPSAWVAYLGFAIVFIASIAFLRPPLGAGISPGPLGGGDRRRLLHHRPRNRPIWARPVWDPGRPPTSSWIMWLTYLGYLILRNLASDDRAVGRLAAVVGIVGFINVPIMHFSVYWWRTQHPSGPTPGGARPGLGPRLSRTAGFLHRLHRIHAAVLVAAGLADRPQPY